MATTKTYSVAGTSTLNGITKIRFANDFVSRLKILYNLKTGEMTVTEIVETTGGSQSNVSKHLSLMLSHGMVGRRRKGTSAFYSIADPSVFDLCDNVCGGIENNLEARRQAFQ